MTLFHIRETLDYVKENILFDCHTLLNLVSMKDLKAVTSCFDKLFPG